MTDSCLFCQIVAGDIPGRFVYEDEAASTVLSFIPFSPLVESGLAG